MNPALGRIFLASLRRRRLATALALLAIALGVALGLAVQLVHDAALVEFDRGLRTLAGAADLQVTGPRSGFDDALFATVASHPQVEEASPVVELDARLAAGEGRLKILGVDVFRLARLQPALMPQADGGDRLAVLDPARIFLSPAARTALELPEGAALSLKGAAGIVALQVAGGVPGAGGGQALGLMDIAAAQAHFGMVGRLSRIDLRLVPGADAAEVTASLQSRLPAGLRVLAPDLALGQEARLSRAYRVNLSMLAAIALLTGGFLVFSTQWLAVVRRRQEFAFLRTLGLDRRRLVQGLLAEGAVLGLVGGVLGVVLGYGLTAVLMHTVGGDLGAGYFRGLRPRLEFAPGLCAVYLLLGVAAGVLGAAVPARHAARQPPVQGLRASDRESMPEARVRIWPALLGTALAALLCLLPPLGGVPVAGYGAVALLLAAAVLVLPGATAAAVRGLRPFARSALLRLGHARLAAAPGQAVVAGAGVVASVALAAAMAIMVSSFRDSVDAWLRRALPADLYVRSTAGLAGGAFDDADAARIAAVRGVARVATLRYDRLRLADDLPAVVLIARPVADGRELPLVEEGPAPATTDDEGGLPRAWISEAMTDLHRLRTGATVALPLGGRTHPFRVAGVWRDYARQHGAVIVDLDTYRALSGDTRIDDLAVHLAAGADGRAVAAAIMDRMAEGAVEIAAPGEIRARSLAIFDRTFLITYLMEAVAVAIGLFGVATTFAALAAARRRELGVLRHLGLTRGEVGRLLALEGALCAAVAVVVGLAAGGAISWVLVDVVNRQSFHWSMDYHLPADGLLAFGLLVTALAAVAARAAGVQAMRHSAVQAVREDW